MSTYQIRPLDPRHDAALARVIRTTIAEFVPPDRQQFTSMADAQLDSLSAFYNTAQRKFWVIEDAAGEVWGGGGFAPLDEGPSDTCELQKCILILRFGVKVLVKRFYNSALGKLRGRFQAMLYRNALRHADCSSLVHIAWVCIDPKIHGWHRTFPL